MSTRKSKAKAIVLAIFLGPFAWLYTYNKSKKQFWINIVLCALSFGLWFPLAWLWAIIDYSLRTNEAFKRSGKAFTKTNRIIFIVIVTMASLILLVGAYSAIRVINQNDKEIAARQQQLAADPPTSQGVYIAVNKERSASGASALGTLNELTMAAEQMCADMTAHTYFDYKNPTTGKEANSFITDNQGELYFKYYVASIFQAPLSMTASESVKTAISNQAQNLNDPKFNSVGWAVCQSPDPNSRYVVGMLAENAEKPITPAPTVNNYYQQPSTPTYRSPVTCSSRELLGSISTTCY